VLDVPLVPLVPMLPVPLVPVIPVPDVLLMLVSVPLVVDMPVADVSVDIVPVVPVVDMPVSVDIVVESVDEVSVVALVFSVLLHATTPKSATSARARKMTSDFFIFGSLLKRVS
jgi:hypothetical protein